MGRDVDVRRERAARRLHLDAVARPDVAHQPRRHRAVGNLAHADPRRRPGRRADRVRAALLDAVDEPAHRDPLAGAEGEDVGELGRDVERDRHGVAAQLGDVGDGE